MNINEMLEKAKEKLKEALEALTELENEKKDIIERYNLANEKDREKIVKEMKISVSKFKQIDDKVSALSQKVKELKEKS